MTRPYSVAVYCSSSDTVDRAYFSAAEEMGRLLGEQGWRLVYGAGSVGLMGAVARAVHAAAGQVYGVIPHALDRKEVTYEECDELLRVETMRQRKALMEENADAYIALPGGLGTLEEIIEIIVLKQLQYHNKPIVFVNTLNYWDPLLELLEEMIRGGFARPSNRTLYQRVQTPEEAIAYITQYTPPAPEPLETKWSKSDIERARQALE